MFNRPSLVAVLVAASIFMPPAPAVAQGEILITQAKAIAGNITPDDTPGFPVTLSVFASYKLASNLVPGPNLNGIVVTAPDVTIDLGGFTLSGGPAGGANNSKFGIVGYGDRLTVRNGTIGAFRIGALYAPNRDYLIVENVRIVNNFDGIDNQDGEHARIQNNTISSNRRYPLVCGKSCHIEGNVVSGNQGGGVYLTTGTVLGNTIVSNSSAGISSGYIVGAGNNTLIDNGSGAQMGGTVIKLFPNACSPVAC